MSGVHSVRKTFRASAPSVVSAPGTAGSALELDVMIGMVNAIEAARPRRSHQETPT